MSDYLTHSWGCGWWAPGHVHTPGACMPHARLGARPSSPMTGLSCNPPGVVKRRSTMTGLSCDPPGMVRPRSCVVIAPVSPPCRVPPAPCPPEGTPTRTWHRADTTEVTPPLERKGSLQDWVLSRSLGEPSKLFPTCIYSRHALLS